MVELLGGYNHVLPFLASSYSYLLVFLAETEQDESMAKCGVLAIDLLIGTDAMTTNRKVFLALGDIMIYA